jgi:hypothetical protein
MKNLLPYIISATALMSLPQLGFCQTLEAINPTAPVSANGALTVKNGEFAFAGYTTTQADFNAALAHPATQHTIQLASGGQCVAGSCYGASVDNEIFAIRDYVPFVAKVVSQPSSMDGRAPARTFISLILDGKSYADKDGGAFDETVRLELTFADAMLSDSKLSAVSLLHNSSVYALVKGDSSNITISDFIWNSDHRSFTFTVNFDCTMRCWEHATSGKKDVKLKGEMSKIKVTVPGWITASN